MSPALLSQRLKEVEAAKVIVRTPSPTEPGIFEYHLTAAGRELEPLVVAFGGGVSAGSRVSCRSSISTRRC
jgi:DNA-binding HxlR family transcriptional regulator